MTKRGGTLAQAGVAGVVVVAVFGVVLRDRVPPLDAWMLREWYAEPGTGAARLATAASGVATLMSLVVLVAAAAAQWRSGASAGRVRCRYLALLGACCATLLSQAAFRRPGPPVVAQDWTYPSGHAVIVTSLAFTGVMLSWHLRSRWRVAITVAAVSAVLLASASRMLLGEHYLIDVVAAMVATTGVGLMAAAALRLPVREVS